MKNEKTMITRIKILAGILMLLTCYSAKAQDIWAHEVVMTGTNRTLSKESICTDSDGHIHIVSSDNRMLYHHWFDGFHWNQETVDAGSKLISEASIGTAPDGAVHIIYYDENSIRHVWENGASWDMTELAEIRDELPCTLRFDGNGNLHTAFIRSDYHLIHAVFRSGHWNLSDVSQTRINRSGVGFDLDSGGDPRFCFMIDKKLFYLYLEGGSWCLEEVMELELDYFRSLDLRVDRNDKPNLSYQSHYGDSYYITKVDGVWVMRFLERFSSYPVDIFLDENDSPHFIGLMNSQIEHLYLMNENWEKEYLDLSSSYKNDVAGIAMHDGTLAVVGCNNTFSQISLLQKEDSVWLPDVVAEYGFFGNPGIAIDQDNDVHLVFTGRSGNTLYHAVKKNGFWQNHLLDEGMGQFSGQCRIGIDGNNRVHITYFKAIDRELIHLMYDGTDWQREVIYNERFVSDSDMVVTGDSTIYVLLSTDDFLYLMRNYEGAWETDRLDTGQVRSVSLCVDSTSRPYCAYYRFDATPYYDMYTLFYQFINDGQWIKEPVQLQSRGSGMERIRLQVSSRDIPMIAYRRMYQGRHGVYREEYFGFRDSEGWNVSRLTNLDGDLTFIPDDRGYLTMVDNAHKYFVSEQDQWMESLYSPFGPSLIGKDPIAKDHQQRTHIIYWISSTSELIHSYEAFPDQGVRLEMTNHNLTYRSDCHLNAYICNNDPSVLHASLCILLEYQQNYWFWPAWRPSFDAVNISIETPLKAMLPIPKYYYGGDAEEPLEGLTFWGALLNDEMTEIIGGYDGIGKWEFSIY